MEMFARFKELIDYNSNFVKDTITLIYSLFINFVIMVILFYFKYNLENTNSILYKFIKHDNN